MEYFIALLNIRRFSSDTFSLRFDFGLKNADFVLKLIDAQPEGLELVVVRLVGNVFEFEERRKRL
jgi:hypothetical protein